MNENIAPPAELGVEERVAEVKKFLKEKAIEPEAPPKKLEGTQAPFEGTYKSQTGLFKGTTSGQVALPTAPINGEMLDVLNSINNKMELERVRFEKTNAVSGDQNIHDWVEASVPSGSIATFSFQLNEGWVFHIQKIQITYQPLSIYNFIRDGIYEPTLSEWVNDYADQYVLFNPPLKAFSQCEISVLNLSGITQIYSVFMGGFLRRYARSTAISAAEENLIQVSIGGAE